VSSRTSVALTKIIFREFLGFEPEWRDAKPDIDAMLADSDAALLIGDPALALSRQDKDHGFRVFDTVEIWRKFTGLGFVFAMWMTRADTSPIDFAAARDEGLTHLDEIAANYAGDIGLSHAEMREYLSQNISYSADESMKAGMRLYFELAEKNGLIAANRDLAFTA
jgi:chorismate dehydratase